jgi:hypothetical protein
MYEGSLDPGDIEDVTIEEVTFCYLVSAFVGSENHSALDLRLGPGGMYYTFCVHKLGDPVGKDKQFTVFSDDFEASVRSGELPAGLQKDLQHECGTN